MNHNPKCFHNHLGPWLLEAGWLVSAIAAIKNGWLPSAGPTQPPPGVNDSLYRTWEGVAIISIDGPMMKFNSKFGGTNTVQTRQALRAALGDPNIGAIMLRVDSPGGSYAGTAELAQEVRNADSLKPIFSYAEDMMASAAYWVGSQTRRIFSNATGQVGSIGTVAVLDDTSKAMEIQGVKVHVISTGEFKGAFSDGTPITPAQIQYIQSLIDSLNEHFLAGVMDGRQIDKKALASVADGRVFIAKEAKQSGLIDQISTFEDALAYAADKKKYRPKMERAEIKRKLAENS